MEQWQIKTSAVHMWVRAEIEIHDLLDCSHAEHLSSHLRSQPFAICHAFSSTNMLAVTNRSSGVSPPASNNAHLIRKERALICVWKSTARSDAELVQGLLSAVAGPASVSSSNNSNDTFSGFAGSAQIIDRWSAKTTVILTGANAHRAALHLTSLPPQSPQYPWKNCSEHNRDWLCPRLSCTDCRPNIGGALSCQQCEEGRPRNLTESAQIWREQTQALAREMEEGSVVEDRADADASSAAGFAHNSSLLDGPAPKRARLATTETNTGSNVDTCAHPSADEEKTRLTVWGCLDQITDENLVRSLQSTTSRANFSGNLSIVERCYAGKAIVVLTGRNAHRAALYLSNLPNGPTNKCPWRNVTEHWREWYCPRLSCVGLEADRPNIDESNGDNRHSARCRACACSRPQGLLQAAQIWDQDLVRSMEEDRRSQQQKEEEEEDLLLQILGGSATEDATNGAGNSITSRPNVDEPSSVSAAGAARPVTPSNNIASAPTSRKLTGSKAEFAIWNAARLAAGVGHPSSSDGILSSSKFFLNRTKDDLSTLLPSLPHRRIWAFDTNPKNGAKGWIWTDCIDTFVDVYLQIDPKNRHAYEVVQQNVPCRMAFDLDMYTGDGVNDDKDDKRMAAAISEYL